MNTILQIVIISSYQSVAEIPRVLFKSIIVYLEPKCLHVFDHKNSRCSGVTFTERMNLPNIRSKLSKMFHALFYRQACIRILFLRNKIIIKGIFDTAPRCVGDSISFQYPFSERSDNLIGQYDGKQYPRGHFSKTCRRQPREESEQDGFQQDRRK